MLALVGNNSDMFEHEEVEESEGINFAKELGCIFKLVSTKCGFGINELFYEIAEKFINPERKEKKRKEKKERKEGKENKERKDSKEKNKLKSKLDKLEKYFSF